MRATPSPGSGRLRTGSRTSGPTCLPGDSPSLPGGERGSGSEADWELEVRTTAFGRPGGLIELETATVSADELRAELEHGAITEWFENRPEGLEQGWTIDSPPCGEGPLQIALEFGGGFEFESDADALGGVLRRGEVTIPYRGLLAFDSRGTHLDARLVGTTDGLLISVDDAGAVYPVVVDPVLNGPVWVAESNQIDAWFGISVAVIGDVNGDGYDDVAVGAPFYDAGQINEGRAWVFHGSASGPSLGSNWYASSGQGRGLLR